MNEINCERGVDLLMDYLEGVLAAPMQGAIETHLAGCPRCTAFIESYRDVPRLLRESTARTMPDVLRRSLLRFLRERR